MVSKRVGCGPGGSLVGKGDGGGETAVVRRREGRAGETVAAESFLARQVPPVPNSRWGRLLPDPIGLSREGPENGKEGWKKRSPGFGLGEPGIQLGGRLK